ncbi:DUF4142 domain-containing protein [Undibacterium sp.]|uniref:DUF4142 domain-containing protein n=1 Tax=Undibacterium sp. TaxID=1914977 RepID=UPI00374DC90C
MSFNSLVSPLFSTKPSRKSMFMVAAAGLAFVGTVAAVSHAHAASKETQGQLSRIDKEFLMNAAQAGTTEILASKTASGKAASQAVKTFAAGMVVDHTKVADELKQLASSKGVNVPDEPSMKQQALMAKLNVLDGAQFDQLYADEIGVAAHKEAVALFRKASLSAKDADVKAFAQKTLPALEHHLQMAESLKAAVNK